MALAGVKVQVDSDSDVVHSESTIKKATIELL